MPKLTYDYVRNYIEEQNYNLLNEEYKTAKDKLKLQCPERHIFWMSFNSFKGGTRCPECFNEKRGQSQRLSYEYIKDLIESERYKLLSDEYKNCDTKLKMLCPEEHITWISFSNFKRGKRCSKCYGNAKLTYKEVKDYIESFEGYKLLSDKYENCDTKLKLQCPENHIFWVSFDKFKGRGYRCPECSRHRKKTNQELIKELQPYENVRENNDKEIEVTCKHCEEWFVPRRDYLTQRLQYINGEIEDEWNMYCSDDCKEKCPIFKQHKYPKHYKPYLDREAQPELVSMVLERDGHTCIICQRHQSEVKVQCHHIEGINWNPTESADMDNCTTLCKDCHKEVHKEKGCTYKDMQCSY